MKRDFEFILRKLDRYLPGDYTPNEEACSVEQISEYLTQAREVLNIKVGYPNSTLFGAGKSLYLISLIDLFLSYLDNTEIVFYMDTYVIPIFCKFKSIFDSLYSLEEDSLPISSDKALGEGREKDLEELDDTSTISDEQDDVLDSFENEDIKEFDEPEDDLDMPSEEEGSYNIDEVTNLDLEDTLFSEYYPELATPEFLSMLYDTWLDNIKGKSFYKTIFSIYNLFDGEGVDLTDRIVLWKITKAISSLITHLIIEAEQTAEALFLFEVYFRDLVNCLLGLVYADTEEEIEQRFLYIVSFLSLDKD